jgi:hypothetical protein
LVRRRAKLEGTQAEWDSVRQPIRLTNSGCYEYRMSGETFALSLEVLAIAHTGAFAFRRTAGVTLLFETNVKEVKSELRADLFPNDAEVANAVTIALEPLVKGSAPHQ